MLSEAEFRYHVSVWREFVAKSLIYFSKCHQVPIFMLIFILIFMSYICLCRGAHSNNKCYTWNLSIHKRKHINDAPFPKRRTCYTRCLAFSHLIFVHCYYASLHMLALIKPKDKRMWRRSWALLDFNLVNVAVCYVYDLLVLR